MSDFKFASLDDLQAWRNDLLFFGKAIVNDNGKHVPLDQVFDPVIASQLPADPAYDHTLSALRDALNDE